MNGARITLWLTLAWTLAALAYGIMNQRGIALTAIPIAAVIWVALRSERVTQSTQLVLPVLLLPGALMCFTGAMQALGYGTMADEPVFTQSAWRIAFFAAGLLIHFAAFFILANESRASDHQSGECVEKV